jgi:hypothetical protein
VAVPTWQKDDDGDAVVFVSGGGVGKWAGAGRTLVISFPSLYSCPSSSPLLFVVSSSLSLGGDVAVLSLVLLVGVGRGEGCLPGPLLAIPLAVSDSGGGGAWW